jgi:site-specific recombinase XerD
MRVYQPTYRDKRTGRYRKQHKYWVEFRDHQRKLRRLPTCRYRSEADRFARNVDALLRCRQTGTPLDAGLAEWLAEIPEKTVRKLQDWGLLSSGRSALSDALSVHLEDLEHSLRAKGRTAQHVRETVSAARHICDGCHFLYWRKISASRVEAFLGELRESKGLSARTYNQKLKAFKQFCAWVVRDGRAADSPVKHLSAVNVQADRRRIRRPLEPHQARTLLEVTSHAKHRYGMDGRSRALLYRLAMETGLRAREIYSLTAGSLDMVERTVVVAAVNSKRRREDTVYLKVDMTQVLSQRIAGKSSTEPLFTMPCRTNLAKMLRADLREAGIPYQDEQGRYLDFHSFRHTCGTWLTRTGVHPKVAQRIMRHSDINLTMNTYTHILREHETTAIEGLPDLSFGNAKRESA